jgi:hypothetical protein
MTKHGVRAAMAAMLGALLLAGCAASTPEAGEAKEALGRGAGGLEQQARGGQQTLPVGGTLTLPAGQSLTVVQVGTELAGVSAPAGERLVVVRVALANPGGAPLPLRPAEDFWLTDGAGRRYAPQATEGLPGEALAAGGQASGSLAFAVGPAAQELRFGWQEQPTTTFAIR